MSPFRLVPLALLLTLTSACATRAPAAAAEPVAPAVLETLPESIGSFDYEGFRHFRDGSGGYSLRYTNTRKRRMADIHVYPVAEENLALEHENLVLGSTRATLQAIGEAVREGVYTDFNVLTAATRPRGARTVARVQATYLRKSLASFTLLYQTEHDGMLVKIRVSMPDNESNRASVEWDGFAERMFELITREIDGTAA